MKLVFVGNRRFVLEEILKANLEVVSLLVIAGTHLERDMPRFGVGFDLVHSKAELLAFLAETEFDVLISNGCPYILPVDKMPKRLYVNIHPSYLPDLRGVDPVIGAILYERDCGATAHIMDNRIDTGEIIAQIRIPYTADLDVSLLYQLSFIAEKMVFRKALALNFCPQYSQREQQDAIYYSRSKADRIINFTENPETLINKVKAFNNKNQGCLFVHKGLERKVHGAQILRNPFLAQIARKANNLEILLSYEDCVVFKLGGKLIQLSRIIGEMSDFIPGSILGAG